MSTTYTGAAPEMAFNHAIVAEVLQILEAEENGIFAKDSQDHLVFTAATQAGADVLSQMPNHAYGIWLSVSAPAWVAAVKTKWP